MILLYYSYLTKPHNTFCRQKLFFPQKVARKIASQSKLYFLIKRKSYSTMSAHKAIPSHSRLKSFLIWFLITANKKLIHHYRVIILASKIPLLRSEYSYSRPLNSFADTNPFPRIWQTIRLSMYLYKFLEYTTPSTREILYIYTTTGSKFSQSLGEKRLNKLAARYNQNPIIKDIPHIGTDPIEIKKRKNNKRK